MKSGTDLDPVALKEVLTFRRDGGSREDALMLARLFFREKTKTKSPETGRKPVER